MDQTLTQDLKKQFEALPIEVQKAITDVNLSLRLQEIVKNNKLMIDQAGKLEIETVLILFGLEPLENFVGNIIKRVGLSSIQASIVAHDVNESIFKNIRETLKKINEFTLEQDGVEIEKKEIPTKEDVLAGIENPQNIKHTEESISLSSQPSNSPKQEVHEEISRGIEIKVNNLPEIAPKTLPEIMPKPLPAVSSSMPKPTVAMPVLNFKPKDQVNQNISPLNNIVESKLTNTVVVPKQTVVIEEKTKLPPEKPKTSGDPYRESII